MNVTMRHWGDKGLVVFDRVVDVLEPDRIRLGTLNYDVQSIRDLVKALTWALARDRFLRAKSRKKKARR